MPLATTSHKQVHDQLVYRGEFESTTPDLLGFQDATLWDITAAASLDPEQIAIHLWPNEVVPVLARSYWSVSHDLTVHDGVLFKQDCLTIPSSLREKLLRKRHAAHRRSEFTLHHACNFVFWPNLSSQITDNCQSRTTCVQHAHQHPREPLEPYPVPTLPWQLVSPDLFELKGVAYLVTVDHYSDFYEIDRIPTIQSSRPPGSTAAGMAVHTPS